MFDWKCDQQGASSKKLKRMPLEEVREATQGSSKSRHDMCLFVLDGEILWEHVVQTEQVTCSGGSTPVSQFTVMVVLRTNPSQVARSIDDTGIIHWSRRSRRWRIDRFSVSSLTAKTTAWLSVHLASLVILLSHVLIHIHCTVFDAC